MAKDQQGGKRPSWTVKSGVLKASVWTENKTDREGRSYQQSSIKIQRAWQDKDGAWHHEDMNLFVEHLLPLQAVLGRVFGRLCITEERPEAK